MGKKPTYKVLVVDDEEPILELLKYNLEKEGYEVKVAGNGHEGVEVAKKFKPDVVLLDIMMPKMDGVEVESYARPGQYVYCIPHGSIRGIL
jgi:two-component system alkaline phosphatase synthesis response regulator PhoP